MKQNETDEIKKLKKELKKCKKKNKKYFDKLVICQEKRSSHWSKLVVCQEKRSSHWAKLVYEQQKNTKLEKTLSSYPYVVLKYLLTPFSFFKKSASPQLKENKSITEHTPLVKKNISDIRVALICDEFSFNSFKYEFNAIVIEPNNWKEKFSREKPDFFFCESAWSGVDSKQRPWQGKIYSSINFKHENRTDLLNILKYCNEHNIPTVFWNKEDPTHFDDKIHDFVKTATNFDYIFTTDEECVQKYKDEYGCQNVFCLPFATQPKLFNPIENYTRNKKITFAGSWYANHKERSKDMEQIFDSILSSGKEIEIYDRYYHDDDKNHIFPDKYLSFIKPAVGHHEIDKIYKSSLYGLNINTVTKSKTMFARRVYELMSSYTVVISNYSKGVENLLGNNVIFADKDPNKLGRLTNIEIDLIRDENLHLALEKHTYNERIQSLLNSIGVPYIPIDRSITIVCVANKETDISEILSFYRFQQLEKKRLLIVLSSKIPNIEIASLYNKYNKSDVGVVAYTYLQIHARDWAEIIDTQYIALMDFSNKFRNNLVKRGLLHTSYIDNIIKMNSEKKYIFTDEAQVSNMLSHKKHFGVLLENNNKVLKDTFYNV